MTRNYMSKAASIIRPTPLQVLACKQTTIEKAFLGQAYIARSDKKNYNSPTTPVESHQ